MITAEDLTQMGYWEDPEAVDPVEMVKEFAKTTGQIPTPPLYAALIQEEVAEWKASYLQNDELNELKELADLLYVVYGYANAKGWDIQEALVRVHDNNLNRVIQDDGTIQRREDGKIIKNPNAPKINLKDLIK